MTEQDTTQADDHPDDAACRHLWVSEYDGDRPIPPGLCQCGCGTHTRLITKNCTRWGKRKGDFEKYVRNHSKRGGPRLFWSKVRKGPGCWEWQGGKDKHGYGSFKAYDVGQIKAHRYSWITQFGSIPHALWVLHKCDNPICVRPDHLYLGTAADNVRDRVARNRSARICGEQRASARLTWEQVDAIRAFAVARKAEYSTRKRRMDLGPELAPIYGVKPGTITSIVAGRSWPLSAHPSLTGGTSNG